MAVAQGDNAVIITGTVLGIGLSTDNKHWNAMLSF